MTAASWRWTLLSMVARKHRLVQNPPHLLNLLRRIRAESARVHRRAIPLEEDYGLFRRYSDNAPPAGEPVPRIEHSRRAPLSSRYQATLETAMFKSGSSWQGSTIYSQSISPSHPPIGCCPQDRGVEGPSGELEDDGRHTYVKPPLGRPPVGNQPATRFQLANVKVTSLNGSLATTRSWPSRSTSMRPPRANPRSS